MDTITVARYQDDQAERWDHFVMELSANGTFLQTRRFLSYHPQGRFADDSRMIYRNQELVAVCPGASGEVDGLRAFRSHPGSTFGGLVVAPTQLRAPKLVELVGALDERLALDGYRAAELKPTPDLFSRVPDEAMQYALFHAGYREEMEIACWLPLDRPYEALRAEFSYNKRYDLKRAEKQGLRAATLDTNDQIREFHALLCLNLQKFDATPVHTAEELLDFHNARLPGEVCFLGVRDAAGALVAGACLFYFAQVNVLHTQYLATDTRITAYAPSSFLYDAVLRAALERGCAGLSMGTCTHEHGRVLNQGLILNKEGYGARHSLNRIYTRRYEAL
ncbi:MAG: GNAT family N-acetyltransferase [Eubacteriales bacterium]|nr:GNAT family N-acetyltransferase [Eubacteriales bacterium]